MVKLESLDVSQRIYNKCPHCDSFDIEGDFVEIIENTAQQRCYCSHCGVDWIMIYTLSDIYMVKDA